MSSTATARSTQSHAVRRDIQGLRAVAVALVVAYHLWPSAIPGGFIGVDVFFVISGFLITAHLLQTPPTSRRALGQFWARRIRRLLPASLLVIASTLAAARLVSPDTEWARTAREAIASTFYVENWALAGSATDYLASDDSPSPFQHFWSLGVEEQFYLVWPLLLALTFWWAKDRTTRRRQWTPRRSSFSPPSEEEDRATRGSNQNQSDAMRPDDQGVGAIADACREGTSLVLVVAQSWLVRSKREHIDPSHSVNIKHRAGEFPRLQLGLMGRNLAGRSNFHQLVACHAINEANLAGVPDSGNQIVGVTAELRIDPGSVGSSVGQSSRRNSVCFRRQLDFVTVGARNCDHK